MPIYHIQKVPSKNIIFWAFCRHNKIKIRVHAHIWAYVYCPLLCLSFMVQSQIFLYRDAQEMIIYQICYILGGCIIKLSSRQRPFTDAVVAKRCRDSETSPKDPTMDGAF